MDTTLSILIDLIPIAVFLVFVVATAADPAVRLWRRVEAVQARQRRHVPRHVHGSRA